MDWQRFDWPAMAGEPDQDWFDYLQGRGWTVSHVPTVARIGSRSYLRKAQELLIAYMIEIVMPKRRILELYLNVAEWGVGVFGAQAAARHYFGTDVSRLSPAESARLAAKLPRPRFYDRNRSTAGLARRAAMIQRGMGQVDSP